MGDIKLSSRIATQSGFALVAMLALIQRHVVMANPDVAWLLTVAERVLRGDRLYIDVLESNPPAAIWLHLPFVVANHLTSIRAETLMDIGVILAAAGSLWLSHRWLMSTAPDWSRSAPYGWLCYSLLVLLPASCFGEREHFALIAFLPALALAIGRAGGAQVRLSRSLTSGALIGLAVSLKPHFVLPVVAIALVSAIYARRLSMILSVDYLIGAAVLFVYLGAITAFYPAYFHEMMPLINLLYLPARLPVWAQLYGAFPAVAAEFLAVGTYLALTRPAARRDPAVLVAIAASLGFLGAALLQGKGWPYHYYPALALGLMVILHIGLLQPAPGRRTAAPLVPLAAGVVLSIQFWMLFNSGLDLRFLYERMRAVAPHPRMASLASDFGVGFPAVRDLDGTWIGRSFSRWIPIHAIGLSQQPGFDPALQPAFDAAVAADLEGFKRALLAGHPDLLFVERRPFDYLVWAAKDAGLTAILSCFRRVDGAVIGDLETPGAHGLEIEFWSPRADAAAAGCP